MNDQISRQKSIEELKKELDRSNVSLENKWNLAIARAVKVIESQSTAEPYVPLSEVYKVIAGHSDYHGDDILAALTCIAEGKEAKPVRPLPADAPDTNVGEWIPCSSGVMPNNSQRVVTTHLLMRKNPYLSTAVYFKTQGQLDDHEWQGEGFYQYSDGGYSLRDDVIAWMPADPYKGVE